jgi:hypothetical protein
MGHYKFKNYNDAFNEQDSDIYGVGIIARLYSAHGMMTRLEYLLERGLAQGRGSRNVCIPPNNLCPNDLSYLSNQFLIGPEIKLNRALTIGAEYELKYKKFTTPLTNDPNHYRRNDAAHTLGLHAYYEINRAIETRLVLERAMRRTNKSSEFFAYDENSVILGISYLF